MQPSLNLCFFWHMHQPYYRDDIASETLMPWTFLHGIKDYYDIPWYQSRFENIKSTFNLVPSLLKQIELYIEKKADDKLLNILYKDIYQLNDDDKKTLESYLFLSNEKNMIKPIRGYYNLYLKYRTHKDFTLFTNEEILDLEVYFLLSWCGVYLKEHNELVIKLLNQGRDYTHQDKMELLATLEEFLDQIVPLYKSLYKKGQISLTTTPYYHPIAPLLIDRKSALDARYDTPMPTTDSDFQEFAVKNIEKAISYFNDIFGFVPNGLWPAEGSVSYKTAELFAQKGINYIYSDEEILYKTLRSSKKENIYKNYFLEFTDGRLDIRFRDKFLSDLIGFTYSTKEAEDAVSDFIKHLKAIYELYDFSPLVNVVLDGENAWEFYKNNGFDFFEKLYSQLEKEEWIETVTADEISTKEDIKTVKIDSLATGSWISGNFDIWIGHKEKNKAWELLDLTYKRYGENIEKLSEEQKHLIEKEFMIALGSDWFWWYGDQHYTVQKSEFDAMFRKHLINIYDIIDIQVDKEILKPIVDASIKALFHTKPKDYIYPQVDGINSDYYEWLNSGIIDLKKELTVMDSSKAYIEKIRYGYNEESMFLSFEGKIKELLESNYQMVLEVDETAFAYNITEGLQDDPLTIFVDSYIEIKLDRDLIKKDKFNFRFTLYKDGNEVQSFPLYNEFTIKLEDLKLVNWYI